MSLLDAVEHLAEQQETEESEEEESDEEGSSYSDDEEMGESESEEEDEDEDEGEEEEPVLKYKRFAKEVVNALHQSQDGESKNVIQCMAVHAKVCVAEWHMVAWGRGYAYGALLLEKLCCLKLLPSAVGKKVPLESFRSHSAFAE